MRTGCLVSKRVTGRMTEQYHDRLLKRTRLSRQQAERKPRLAINRGPPDQQFSSLLAWGTPFQERP